MRRNSVRKFIHALMDLLPLFIIPIFAININQKSVDPISVEVQEKESINFNQEFDTTYSFTYPKTTNGITISLDNDNRIVLNGTATSNVSFVYDLRKPIQVNHVYIVRNLKSNGLGIFGVYGLEQMQRLVATGNNPYATITIQSGTVCDNYIYGGQIYDLTEMYGSSNEPTLQEFESTFNYYYPYTDSQKMLVNKPSPTTYNSTDIGSQFLYSLYKPVNDYFNFNNLFNMNDIWNWIQLNLFQGTAPLPVFIIWNIIIYEFFVDLLFLLYAVFMFIIDWSTGLIDKFLGRSRT